LWSPVINYRLGRSGCQTNCIACGQVCPTAALRPLGIEEKLGVGEFSAQGPVRLGTAFVDRGRCLPWAMGRPCLVCHEMCPVSPKAIFTRTVFEAVRDAEALPAKLQGQVVVLEGVLPTWANVAGGDYYLRPTGAPEAALRRITAQAGIGLITERPLTPKELLAAGGRVDVLVKLEVPFVDPSRCIGCGMCENACPVAGRRAIGVFSENESRSGSGRLLM
jgi:ferredoxin